MKVAIWVKTVGQRRRSRPRIRSRIVVVAASSSEATTPRVPFATMFHAPSRPSTDSDRPSQSTRSPCPARGGPGASTATGSWWVPRGASQPTGTRASTVPAASRTAYPAKATRAVRGVITTMIVNSTTEAIFTSGASRCTGLPAFRWSGWACPAPTSGHPFAPADQPEAAGPETEGDQHAGHPGQPGGQPGVAGAADAVAGQRAVPELMLPLLPQHAGAAGDLVVRAERASLAGGRVQPVRAGRGEVADHAGQQQRDEQPAGQEPAEPPVHAATSTGSAGAVRNRRRAYTRSGRTRATVVTVVAAIRPSPRPISTCTPANVPDTQGSDRSVVPPSAYSRTNPCEAATTLTTDAISAVAPSPPAVRGRTRSSPTTSR